MNPQRLNRCVWCGADLGDGDLRMAGRVRCARCGVSSTDPWPTEQELKEAYESWYRPEGGRFSGFGDALLRRTRGRLAGRVDRIAPPGPVLDVGAGDGVLLDALQRKGREALGLERSSSREDIRAGEITEVGGEWAAVVFWHTLEHMEAPAATLQAAADLLQPAGVVFVAVPNSASLQARLFGDRWLALDLPRHLVHLSTEPLLNRLRAIGLRVERISFWRGGQVLFGWLHGLVGSLPGHPDLYDAIRKPAARSVRIPPAKRAAAIAAALLLFPLAALGAAIEVATRRGGTVYVEARRA